MSFCFVLDEHHHGLQFERRLLVDVVGFHAVVSHARICRAPADGRQVLRRIVLDVQIQRDERPVSLFPLSGPFDDRLHLGKKVSFSSVGSSPPAFLRRESPAIFSVDPGKVLLGDRRQTGGESPVEAGRHTCRGSG